jgi:molybdopterin-guanine dinucleotide biosynthesis protein A
MGEDKALIRLGGGRLLDVAVAALRPVAGRVVLACGSEPRYTSLGFDLALDAEPDVGPLAGLLAGLEAADTEWVVVLACDLPRASSEVVGRLLERAAEKELDVCLLELERGTQPLYGVYRRRCAHAVHAAIEAGQRRMVSFHDRTVGGRPLRVGSLRLDELGPEVPNPGVNLNTPEELAAERDGAEGPR